MTATCTICGEILKVLPDVRGVSFTFGELGNQFKKHMASKHMNEPQTCIAPEILAATCPILTMINVMGITTQGTILFSYLKSEDADFADQVRQMRETVEKAIAQKIEAPKVVA